jgi:hypothetical protein
MVVSFSLTGFAIPGIKERKSEQNRGVAILAHAMGQELALLRMVKSAELIFF